MRAWLLWLLLALSLTAPGALALGEGYLVQVDHLPKLIGWVPRATTSPQGARLAALRAEHPDSARS